MHPFLAPDFHVRWSTLVPQAVEPDIRHALEIAKQNIEAICVQDPAAATYESTFLALERATEELGRGWGRLNHLDSVSDSPAQREALGKMLPEVTDFYSSLALNERLWAVIKAVGESPEMTKLTPIQRRFVDETLADFRNSGADLPPAQKDRIAAIEAELSKITKEYSEHVLDSTNAWELIITDEAKLAGLPDSAMAGAAANARSKGHENAWRFSLQFPSMFPIMQHLHDDGTRRQVWEASSKVGGYGEFDNTGRKIPRHGSRRRTKCRNNNWQSQAIKVPSRSNKAMPGGGVLGREAATRRPFSHPAAGSRKVSRLSQGATDSDPPKAM